MKRKICSCTHWVDSPRSEAYTFISIGREAEQEKKAKEQQNLHFPDPPNIIAGAALT